MYTSLFRTVKNTLVLSKFLRNDTTVSTDFTLSILESRIRYECAMLALLQVYLLPLCHLLQCKYGTLLLYGQ